MKRLHSTEPPPPLDEQSIALPDDVLRIIAVDYLLGRPVMVKYMGNFSEDDVARLSTYFRLPLVSQAFRRVVSRHVVDWKAMFPALLVKYMGTAFTDDYARSTVFYESELLRVHRAIDTIVQRENVTYRSPVKRRLSTGKLALKKLRHATYPSQAVESAVLDLLRHHERLCRQRRAAEKKRRQHC